MSGIRGQRSEARDSEVQKERADGGRGQNRRKGESGKMRWWRRGDPPSRSALRRDKLGEGETRRQGDYKTELQLSTFNVELRKAIAISVETP